MSEQQQWHRLFGMGWMDYLSDQPGLIVDVEKDLSQQQQRLDVLLLRKSGIPITCRLPDGFEELAAHNLISFKSYRETLDSWTMDELIGHYVAYRKLVSASTDNLIGEQEVALFVVTARYPHNLAQQIHWQAERPGVYRTRSFSKMVRVVVINELPAEDHNAVLLLFSANDGQIRYASQNYRLRDTRTSTFFLQLFRRYREEGLSMSYTKEQFWKDSLPWLLSELSVEERLKDLPVEERLKGVPVEERLKGVPVEERLKGLPVEERLKDVPVEELLKALPPEVIAALRQQALAEDRPTKE